MKVLLMSPPIVGENVQGASMSDVFDFTKTVQISQELRELYRGLAETYGCFYMDTSAVIKVSKDDGVHLNLEGNRKLAEAVYRMVTGSILS